MNDFEQVERLRQPVERKLMYCPAWKSLLSDESGQDMIEYVLVASLIALTAVSAMNSLGTKIASAYTSISSNLTSNT